MEALGWEPTVMVPSDHMERLTTPFGFPANQSFLRQSNVKLPTVALWGKSVALLLELPALEERVQLSLRSTQHSQRNAKSLGEMRTGRWWVLAKPWHGGRGSDNRKLCFLPSLEKGRIEALLLLIIQDTQEDKDG